MEGVELNSQLSLIADGCTWQISFSLIFLITQMVLGPRFCNKMYHIITDT